MTRRAAPQPENPRKPTRFQRGVDRSDVALHHEKIGRIPLRSLLPVLRKRKKREQVERDHHRNA
jgi:hypothetical protein